MSQSKGASSSKASSKAKPAAKRRSVAAAKTVETVETLRIIPAPQPASLPEASLTADEKALSKQALELAARIELALKKDERAIALDPAEGAERRCATLALVRTPRSTHQA